MLLLFLRGIFSPIVRAFLASRQPLRKEIRGVYGFLITRMC